ncbi:MAG TPA: hypothetical protein VIJ70_00915 [Gaiellaceae bacterium]
MRRLSFTLLCGLLLAPAALAGVRASGDGVLELQAVNATTVTIAGKGALWGQVDQGRLYVTDPIDTDGLVYVSGADRAPRAIGDTTTLYIGKNMHFRITGGTYKLTFVKSTGIDLTAVGVGKALMAGDPTADTTGTYALDGGKWTPVPVLRNTLPVLFGVQPTVTGLPTGGTSSNSGP